MKVQKIVVSKSGKTLGLNGNPLRAWLDSRRTLVLFWSHAFNSVSVWRRPASHLPIESTAVGASGQRTNAPKPARCCRWSQNTYSITSCLHKTKVFRIRLRVAT